MKTRKIPPWAACSKCPKVLPSAGVIISDFSLMLQKRRACSSRGLSCLLFTGKIAPDMKRVFEIAPPPGAYHGRSFGIALNSTTRRHPRLGLVAGSRGPTQIHIRGLCHWAGVYTGEPTGRPTGHLGAESMSRRTAGPVDRPMTLKVMERSRCRSPAHRHRALPIHCRAPAHAVGKTNYPTNCHW